MNMYTALLIVFGFFAIGDIMGVATKAKVSSVFVALMLFLICFVTGILPADLVDTAAMGQVSKLSSAFVVFNMGTSVNLGQMKKEWKVVVMSLIAMLVAIGSVLVVAPIMGRDNALVAIPIVNGGIVATQIMTEAALAKGATVAAALGTVVFAVQKFVGTIPASRCGLSEAHKLAAEYREAKSRGVDLLNEAAAGETAVEVKPQPWKKYEKYFTAYTTLGITALAAFVANILGKISGELSAMISKALHLNFSISISMTIWCLVLGMIVGQLGIVPPSILEKGKSSGFWMVATFCTLIPSLAKISIADLKTLAWQTILVFAAVLIGCFVLLYFLPLWKLVGSRNMAMGVAMSQLLGFPATYLIVNEVATAVAADNDEKEYIVKRLSPAFVVSGFVSVTTISVIVAGIFADIL